MPPSKLESGLTMIAVDTNVLVRLLVRDDDVQARRAAAVDEAIILDALKGVVGLPNVSVEDGLAVGEALDLLAAGMDFADALHVASSRDATQFATFDKRLKKCADTVAPGRRVLEA